MLRDGESNPGLPRDRRGYSPLYYRGVIRECSFNIDFQFKKKRLRTLNYQTFTIIIIIFTRARNCKIRDIFCVENGLFQTILIILSKLSQLSPSRTNSMNLTSSLQLNFFQVSNSITVFLVSRLGISPTS